jgi:hypothetical protein
MSQTFAISSSSEAGCTFLDWSIFYLSGQHDFYKVKSNNVIQLPLVESPLNIDSSLGVINCHRHPRNHFHGLPHTQRCIDLLTSVDHLNSIYPISWDAFDISELFGMDVYNLSADSLNLITHIRRIELERILEWLSKQNIPTIFLAPDYDCPALFNGTRQLDHSPISHTTADSMMSWFEQRCTILNGPVMSDWKQQGLWTNDVNQRRERCALLLRPFTPLYNSKDFVVPDSVLQIKFTDWLHTGTDVVKEVLAYLNLSPDNTCWNSWLAVYNQWQTGLTQYTNFFYNLDNIVNDVVGGTNREIGSLNFYQECVLLHCLIYQFDLSIQRTDKLPTNCQDIHTLLESNCLGKIQDRTSNNYFS